MGAQLPLEFRITGFSDAGSEMKRIADLANRIAEQAGRPIALPSVSAPGAVNGSGEQGIVPGRPETYSGAALQGARQMEEARQRGIESGFDGINPGDRAGQKAAEAASRDFVAQFEKAVKSSAEAQGKSGRELTSSVDTMVREMKVVLEAATREMAGMFGGESGLRTQARNLMIQDAPQSVALTLDPAALQRIAQETFTSAARNAGAAAPTVTVAQGTTTQPVAAPIQPLMYKAGAVPPQVSPTAPLPQTPPQSVIKDNARAAQDEGRAARLRRQAAELEVKLQEQNLQKVRSMVIEGQRTIVNAATNQPVSGYTPVPESPAAKSAASAEVRRLNGQLKQRYDQQVSEVSTEVKTAPAQAIAPIVEQVTGQPMEMVSQMPSRSNPAPRTGPSPMGITQAGGTGGPSNGKGRTVGSPQQRVMAEIISRYPKPSAAPQPVFEIIRDIFNGGVPSPVIPDDATPEVRAAEAEFYRQDLADFRRRIDEHVPFLKDLGFDLENLPVGAKSASKALTPKYEQGKWLDKDGNVILTKKKKGNRPAGSPVLRRPDPKTYPGARYEPGPPIREADQRRSTAPAVEFDRALSQGEWPQSGFAEFAKWRDSEGNPVEPGFVGAAYPDRSVGPAPRSIPAQKKRRKSSVSTAPTLPPLPPEPEPIPVGVPASEYGKGRTPAPAPAPEPKSPKPLTKSAADKLIAKAQGTKPLGGQKRGEQLSSDQQRRLRTLGFDEFGAPLPVSSIDSDLASLKGNELRSLAPQYGVKGSGKGITEEYLRRAIQDMRDAGVKPATATGGGRGAEPPSAVPPTPAPTPEPPGGDLAAELAAIGPKDINKLRQFAKRNGLTVDKPGKGVTSVTTRAQIEQQLGVVAAVAVEPEVPVGVPASEYGKGRSLPPTEGKSSEDILAGITGRALEVQPDAGYTTWTREDLIAHLRARRASLSKDVRKAQGIPATAKGNRKTDTYIRDLQRLDQLGLATDIAPPAGAGGPLTPEQAIGKMTAEAVSNMSWQQVLDRGAGLGIDPDGDEYIGRAKLEEHLRKGALDELKRQDRGAKPAEVQAEVQAVAEETGAAVAEAVAPPVITRAQARASLESMGRKFKTPIKNPDLPATPVQLRAIEQAAAEMAGVAKAAEPKAEPRPARPYLEKVRASVNEELEKAAPRPYDPQEISRILARRSRGYVDEGMRRFMPRGVDGTLGPALGPVVSDTALPEWLADERTTRAAGQRRRENAEYIKKSSGRERQRLEAESTDIFGRPLDIEPSVRPESLYGLGERTAGPSARDLELARQREAAISQFGVAPVGYTGYWNKNRLDQERFPSRTTLRRRSGRVPAGEPSRWLPPDYGVGTGSSYGMREMWRSTGYNLSTQGKGNIFDNTIGRLEERKGRGESLSDAEARRLKDFNDLRNTLTPEQIERQDAYRLDQQMKMQGMLSDAARPADFIGPIQPVELPDMWRLQGRSYNPQGDDWFAPWKYAGTEIGPARGYEVYPTAGPGARETFATEAEALARLAEISDPTTTKGRSRKRFPRGSSSGDGFDQNRGKKPERYGQYVNMETGEFLRRKGRGKKAGMPVSYKQPKKGESTAYPGYMWVDQLVTPDTRQGQIEQNERAQARSVEDARRDLQRQAASYNGGMDREVPDSPELARLRAGRDAIFANDQQLAALPSIAELEWQRGLGSVQASPSEMAAIDAQIAARRQREGELTLGAAAPIDAEIQKEISRLRDQWVERQLAQQVELPGVGVPSRVAQYDESGKVTDRFTAPFMVQPLPEADPLGNKFITTSADPETLQRARFKTLQESYEYIARRKLTEAGQIGGGDIGLSSVTRGMKRGAIQGFAKELGLKATGTNAELRLRIAEKTGTVSAEDLGFSVKQIDQGPAAGMYQAFRGDSEVGLPYKMQTEAEAEARRAATQVVENQRIQEEASRLRRERNYAGGATWQTAGGPVFAGDGDQGVFKFLSQDGNLGDEALIPLEDAALLRQRRETIAAGGSVEPMLGIPAIPGALEQLMLDRAAGGARFTDVPLGPVRPGTRGRGAANESENDRLRRLQESGPQGAALAEAIRNGAYVPLSGQAVPYQSEVQLGGESTPQGLLTGATTGVPAVWNQLLGLSDEAFAAVRDTVTRQGLADAKGLVGPSRVDVLRNLEQARQLVGPETLNELIQAGPGAAVEVPIPNIFRDTPLVPGASGLAGMTRTQRGKLYESRARVPQPRPVRPELKQRAARTVKFQDMNAPKVEVPYGEEGATRLEYPLVDKVIPGETDEEFAQRRGLAMAEYEEKLAAWQVSESTAAATERRRLEGEQETEKFLRAQETVESVEATRALGGLGSTGVLTYEDIAGGVAPSVPFQAVAPRTPQEERVLQNLRARNEADMKRPDRKRGKRRRGKRKPDTTLFEQSKRLIAAANDTMFGGTSTPAEMEAYSRLAGGGDGEAPLSPARMRELLALSAASGSLAAEPYTGPVRKSEGSLDATSMSVQEVARLASLQEQIPGFADLVGLAAGQLGGIPGEGGLGTVERLRRPVDDGGDRDVQRLIARSNEARRYSGPTSQQRLLAESWFDIPEPTARELGSPRAKPRSRGTDTGDGAVIARQGKLIENYLAEQKLERDVNAQLSLGDENPAGGPYSPALAYEMVEGRYERILTPLQQMAADAGLDPSTIDKSLKLIDTIDDEGKKRGKEFALAGQSKSEITDARAAGALLADMGQPVIDVNKSINDAFEARSRDPKGKFPLPRETVEPVRRSLSDPAEIIAEAQRVSGFLAGNREYTATLAALQPGLGTASVPDGRLIGAEDGSSMEQLEARRKAEGILRQVYEETPANRAKSIVGRVDSSRGTVAEQLSLASVAVEAGRQSRGILEGDLTAAAAVRGLVEAPPPDNTEAQRVALSSAVFEDSKRLGGRENLYDQKGPRGTEQRKVREELLRERARLEARIADPNVALSDKGEARQRLKDINDDPRIRRKGKEVNEGPGAGFRQLFSDIADDLGFRTEKIKKGKGLGKFRAFGPDGNEIGLYKTEKAAQSAILAETLRRPDVAIPTASTMGGYLGGLGVSDEDIKRSILEGTPLEVQSKTLRDGKLAPPRPITAGEEFGLLSAAAAEQGSLFKPAEFAFGDPVSPVEVAADLRQLSDPRTSRTTAPPGRGRFQLAPENVGGITRPDDYKEKFQSALVANRQGALQDLLSDLRRTGEEVAKNPSYSYQDENGERVRREASAFRDPVLARLADLGVDASPTGEFYRAFADAAGLPTNVPVVPLPLTGRTGGGLSLSGTRQRRLGLTGRSKTGSVSRSRRGPGLGLGGGAGRGGGGAKPPTGGFGDDFELPEDPFDKVEFGRGGFDASGRPAINLTQGGEEALTRMAKEAGEAGVGFDDFYSQIEDQLLARAMKGGDPAQAAAAVTRAAALAEYAHESGRKSAAGGAGGGGTKPPPSAAGAAPGDEPPKGGKSAKRKWQKKEQIRKIRDEWAVGGWSDLQYGVDPDGNITVQPKSNVKAIEGYIDPDTGDQKYGSQFAYTKAWDEKSDIAGKDFDQLKKLTFQQRLAQRTAAKMRENTVEPMVPAFDADGNPIMKTVKAGTAKYDAEGKYIPGTETWKTTGEQRMIPESQQTVAYTGPDGLPTKGMMGKRGTKGGYWDSPEGQADNQTRIMEERARLRRLQMQQEEKYNRALLADVQSLAQIADLRAQAGLDPSVVESRANAMVTNLQARNAVGDVALQNPAFTPALNDEGMRRFIESRKRAGRNAEAEELENIYRSSLPLPDKLDEFNNTKRIQQQEQLRARQDQEDPMAKRRAQERALVKDEGFLNPLLSGAGKTAKATPEGQAFLARKAASDARMMLFNQMQQEATEAEAAKLGINTKKKKGSGFHGMGKGLDEIGQQLRPDALIQNAVGMTTWMLPMTMTFGLIGFLQETLETSLEIEKAYRKTQNQFQLAYGPQAQGYLQQFNSKVVSIAQQMNLPQVQLNEVGRSIVASFGPGSGVELGRSIATGSPTSSGMTAATDQLQAVAEFSYVTGREPEKVKDEFQSISLAWGPGGRAIGDLLVAAEQSYGVKPDTLSQGVADSSTVAAASGFRIEEWTALIAETERKAGSRSAVAVAESLNRALTDIPRKQKEVLDLRQQLPSLQNNEEFGRALATGDVAGLLTAISDVAAEIKGEQDERGNRLWRKGEQDLIVTTLGSERNDKDFWAALSSLSAIRSGDDDRFSKMLTAAGEGGLGRRYENTQTSLKGSIDSMVGTITAIFVQLTKTGIMELFAGLVAMGASLLKVFNSVVSAFTWFEENTRGVGKALVQLAVTAKLLNMVFTKMATFGGVAAGPGRFGAIQAALPNALGRFGEIMGGDRKTHSLKYLTSGITGERAVGSLRDDAFNAARLEQRIAKAESPGFFGKWGQRMGVTPTAEELRSKTEKAKDLKDQGRVVKEAVKDGTTAAAPVAAAKTGKATAEAVVAGTGAAALDLPDDSPSRTRGRRKSMWARMKERAARLSPFDDDGNIGGRGPNQGGFLDVGAIGDKARDLWNRYGPGPVRVWRGDRVDDFGEVVSLPSSADNRMTEHAGRWWSTDRETAESYSRRGEHGSPRVRSTTVSKKEYRRAIRKAADFHGWEKVEPKIGIYDNLPVDVPFVGPQGSIVDGQRVAATTSTPPPGVDPRKWNRPGGQAQSAPVPRTRPPAPPRLVGVAGEVVSGGLPVPSSGRPPTPPRIPDADNIWAEADALAAASGRPPTPPWRQADDVAVAAASRQGVFSRARDFISSRWDDRGQRGSIPNPVSLLRSGFGKIVPKFLKAPVAAAEAVEAAKVARIAASGGTVADAAAELGMLGQTGKLAGGVGAVGRTLPAATGLGGAGAGASAFAGPAIAASALLVANMAMDSFYKSQKQAGQDIYNSFSEMTPERIAVTQNRENNVMGAFREVIGGRESYESIRARAAYAARRKGDLKSMDKVINEYGDDAPQDILEEFMFGGNTNRAVANTFRGETDQNKAWWKRPVSWIPFVPDPGLKGYEDISTKVYEGGERAGQFAITSEADRRTLVESRRDLIRGINRANPAATDDEVRDQANKYNTLLAEGDFTTIMEDAKTGETGALVAFDIAKEQALKGGNERLRTLIREADSPINDKLEDFDFGTAKPLDLMIQEFSTGKSTSGQVLASIASAKAQLEEMQKEAIKEGGARNDIAKSIADYTKQEMELYSAQVKRAQNTAKLMAGTFGGMTKLQVGELAIKQDFQNMQDPRLSTEERMAARDSAIQNLDAQYQAYVQNDGDYRMNNPWAALRRAKSGLVLEDEQARALLVADSMDIVQQNPDYVNSFQDIVNPVTGAVTTAADQAAKALADARAADPTRTTGWDQWMNEDILARSEASVADAQARLDALAATGSDIDPSWDDYVSRMAAKERDRFIRDEWDPQEGDRFDIAQEGGKDDGKNLGSYVRGGDGLWQYVEPEGGLSNNRNIGGLISDDAVRDMLLGKPVEGPEANSVQTIALAPLAVRQAASDAVKAQEKALRDLGINNGLAPQVGDTRTLITPEASSDERRSVATMQERDFLWTGESYLALAREGDKSTYRGAAYTYSDKEGGWVIDSEAAVRGKNDPNGGWRPDFIPYGSEQHQQMWNDSNPLAKRYTPAELDALMDAGVIRGDGTGTDTRSAFPAPSTSEQAQAQKDLADAEGRRQRAMDKARADKRKELEAENRRNAAAGKGQKNAAQIAEESDAAATAAGSQWSGEVTAASNIYQLASADVIAQQEAAVFQANIQMERQQVSARAAESAVTYASRGRNYATIMEEAAAKRANVDTYRSIAAKYREVKPKTYVSDGTMTDASGNVVAKGESFTVNEELDPAAAGQADIDARNAEADAMNTVRAAQQYARDLRMATGPQRRAAYQNVIYAYNGRNQGTMAIEVDGLRQSADEMYQNYTEVLATGDDLAAAQALNQWIEAKAAVANKFREVAEYQRQLNRKVKGSDRRGIIIAAYVAINGLTKQAFELQIGELERLKNEALEDAKYYESIGEEQAAEEAKNRAGQYVAEIANKNREIRNAARLVAASQNSMLMATLGYHGDTVGQAAAQLAEDQRVLEDMLANPQDFTPDQVNNQRAKVTSSAQGVRQAQFQKENSDIDFALTLGQITTGQAIKQLEAMLILYADNQQMTREIELKIHSLKDQGDLSWNLPELLNLPSFYDAKRLNQTKYGGEDSLVEGLGGNNITPAAYAAHLSGLAAVGATGSSGYQAAMLTYEQYKAQQQALNPDRMFTMDMVTLPDGRQVNRSEKYYMDQYAQYQQGFGVTSPVAAGSQTFNIYVNNGAGAAEVGAVVAGLLDPTRSTGQVVGFN